VDLKQKARELGVEVEEYPDRMVAKYGNIAVEGKIANNAIEVTVKGFPVPVKGIIRPEKGYVQQTVYIGPVPFAGMRYKVAEGDFLGAIKCFLETVAIVVAIALASTIVGAAELNPLFLLMAALELLIAPMVAAIVCL